MVFCYGTSPKDKSSPKDGLYGSCYKTEEQYSKDKKKKPKKKRPSSISTKHGSVPPLVPKVKTDAVEKLVSDPQKRALSALEKRAWLDHMIDNFDNDDQIGQHMTSTLKIIMPGAVSDDEKNEYDELVAAITPCCSAAEAEHAAFQVLMVERDESLWQQISDKYAMTSRVVRGELGEVLEAVKQPIGYLHADYMSWFYHSDTDQVVSQFCDKMDEFAWLRFTYAVSRGQPPSHVAQSNAAVAAVAKLGTLLSLLAQDKGQAQAVVDLVNKLSDPNPIDKPYSIWSLTWTMLALQGVFGQTLDGPANLEDNLPEQICIFDPVGCIEYHQANNSSIWFAGTKVGIGSELDLSWLIDTLTNSHSKLFHPDVVVDSATLTDK
jgi:hypothetical protein